MDNGNAPENTAKGSPYPLPEDITAGADSGNRPAENAGEHSVPEIRYGNAEVPGTSVFAAREKENAEEETPPERTETVADTGVPAMRRRRTARRAKADAELTLWIAGAAILAAGLASVLLHSEKMPLSYRQTGPAETVKGTGSVTEDGVTLSASGNGDTVTVTLRNASASSVYLNASGICLISGNTAYTPSDASEEELPPSLNGQPSAPGTTTVFSLSFPDAPEDGAKTLSVKNINRAGSGVWNAEIEVKQ